EELGGVLPLEEFDAPQVPVGVGGLRPHLHLEAALLGPELAAELREHVVRVNLSVDRTRRPPRIPRRMELLHVDSARLVAREASRLAGGVWKAVSVWAARIAAFERITRRAHEFPAALVDVVVEDAARIAADELRARLRERRRCRADEGDEEIVVAR